jgi:DNA repair exonuclease SbcCD nuclease subunit
MKDIIYSDPHIYDKTLDELNEIFKEIYSYITPETVVICCGDYYHLTKLSPRVIDFGTYWAKKIKEKSKDYIILVGNHPSESSQISSVKYLYNLGVKIGEEYKQRNVDLGFNYFGHKETEKSEMFVGRNTPTKEKYFINTNNLKEHRYSILGHQHNFQKISETIYHIGSCINLTFGESDKKKYIGIIDEELEFKELKSVIPMFTINSIDKLNSLPKKAKVRIVFDDFQYFKNNIRKAQEIGKKFYNFKVKLNFEKITEQSTRTKEKQLKDMVIKWLDNKIKDVEIKKELEIEFKENNVI